MIKKIILIKLETNKTKIVSLNKDIKAKEESEKILNYSRQKFHKEGFYKSTMDDLASELRVSKKTIYKYFPSKEKLLEEICIDTSKNINADLEIIIEGKENVVIKFVKLLNMHNKISMNISDKWIKDLTLHTPELKKKSDEMKNHNINNVMKRLLEQGKKEKLIENYPTPIIILAFISSLMAVVNQDFLINNKFTFQNAVKITYEMLLNGILTDLGKEKFKKAKSLLAKEINVQN